MCRLLSDAQQIRKNEQRKNLAGAKVAFDCDSPIEDTPAVNPPSALPSSVAVLSSLKASSPFQSLAHNSRHRGVSGPNKKKKKTAFFFSLHKACYQKLEACMACTSQAVCLLQLFKRSQHARKLMHRQSGQLMTKGMEILSTCECFRHVMDH